MYILTEVCLNLGDTFISQILNNIIPNPFIPRMIDKGEVEGYDKKGYPLPLSVWTHIQTGKEYVVKCVANTTAIKEGYPVQIVYQNTLTYEVFTQSSVKLKNNIVSTLLMY